MLGLALGGGGARGLCHVGVWRELEPLGVRPDVVAGTSMGGIIGALIAAGHDSASVQKISANVDWLKVLNWGFSGRVFSAKRLRSFLGQYLPETFEELEIPLVVVATDVASGTTRYLHSGDLLAAVHATAAFPGVLEPVRVGSDLLMDGGMLNQLPVDAAHFFGAQNVIAVNATSLQTVDMTKDSQPVPTGRFLKGTFKEAVRGIEIMQAQLTKMRLSLFPPDVLIDPAMDDVGFTSFNKFERAAEAGAEATRERAEQLKALLG